MWIVKYFKRIKYSDYPLWYNLTLGMWYDSPIYFHVWYKHTKKHKDELQKVTDEVMAIRKRIIGR